MEFFSIFQEVWAVRALIASSLVGLMCGALGAFIVLRNMSLIGDALSHAILPGVVVAFMLRGYSTLAFFIGAVGAGLLSAVGITWIQQKIKTKNDAAIGIVFTAMFSLGVIGISALSKNEGVHLDLKDFLFGNVLTVSDEDLMLTLSVTLFVLLSIYVFYRHLFITTFQEVIARTMGISVRFVHYFLMLLLSFAVVASLQTVGVILVVAMLITPASTALLLSDKLRNVVILAALIGLIAAQAGFALSVILETTPGPAMAVTATVMYFIAAIFAPRKGLLAKRMASHSQQLKVESEDLIKQAFKLELSDALSLQALSTATGISGGRFKRHMRNLSNQNLLIGRSSELQLTDQGKKQANKLIRAHRLWETYLVDKVGLGATQIHEDAEIYEHHLTDEMLDEVDRVLGYPKQDPHGSPIPRDVTHPVISLAQFKAGQTGIIARDQNVSAVIRELWSRNVAGGDPIEVVERNNDVIIINVNGQRVSISLKVAELIGMENGDHSS